MAWLGLGLGLGLPFGFGLGLELGLGLGLGLEQPAHDRRSIQTLQGRRSGATTHLVRVRGRGRVRVRVRVIGLGLWVVLAGAPVKRDNAPS